MAVVETCGKFTNEPEYCHSGCTEDNPCFGKVCKYKNQGIKIQIKGSNDREPEFCHRSCIEDNPCFGKVCPYKKRGTKKRNSKGNINEIIATSKDNEIKERIASKPEFCHRSCTEDNPCFGKVCPYKKRGTKKRNSKGNINEIIATSKDNEIKERIASKPEYCPTDCTEDNPCFGKICQYKNLGANNDIIIRLKNIEIRGNVPSEPDFCNPNCFEDRPCNGKVCPYKNTGPTKVRNRNNRQFVENPRQPPGGTGQQPPGGTSQQPPVGFIIMCFLVGLGILFLGIILAQLYIDHIWKARNTACIN